MLTQLFPGNVSTTDRSGSNATRNCTLLAMLLLSTFAASARASQIYSFSFTPTSGPIESFGFSFTVPTFVTTGQSPAFTPITITDGTNSETLSLDFAETPGGYSCFEFGTATDSTLNNGGLCGVEWGPPNGGVF
jgi:hypothetical protein